MALANILIVDDTPQNSALLSRILEKQYQVRSVDSGKIALQKVSGWADLVLLDTKMPDMDGYEVCRLLKATPATANTPVIFLGTFDNILKTKTYRVGGNDYITKPFQAEEVLGKVRQQLILLQTQKKIHFLNQSLAAKNQELQEQKEVASAELQQLQQTQQHLLQLALYDSTTGLPNRNSFLGKIKELLARYQQQTEYRFAVFLLQFQLDRTKNVGIDLAEFTVYLDREEQDKLFRSLAERLKKCLASTALLSRFEGDRFAIVTDKLTAGETEIQQWVEAIQRQLSEPFSVVLHKNSGLGVEQQIYLQMRSGIAVGSDRYTAAYELLQDAAIALYQTQKSDRSYHIFQPDSSYQQKIEVVSTQAAPIYQQLKAHFIESLERGKISLSYQPIFALARDSLQDIENVQIVGLEVLDQCHQEYHKLLVLTNFFQNLESSSISTNVSNFTLELTASYLRELQLQHQGQEDLFLTMQCSEKFLYQPHLGEKIAAILSASDIDPAFLHLDLLLKSESFEKEQTLLIIRQLAKLGIKLNLVCKYLTYGTLKNLEKLPFYSYKLSSNLVEKIISAEATATLPPKDNKDIAYSRQYVAKSEIARIVSLAHASKIKVTAKAVATREQLVYLTSVGCDYACGSFLSKPLDAQSLETFLVWRV